MLATKFTFLKKYSIQLTGCPFVVKSRALESADRPGFESCLVIYALFDFGQGNLPSRLFPHM